MLKRYAHLLFVVLPLLTLTSAAPPSTEHASECAVRALLQEVQVARYTYAVTAGIASEPQEVQQLFQPAVLNAGTYRVNVTRQGNDLYRLGGNQGHLLTFACYEYVYHQNAILSVPQRGNAGTLYFER